MYYRTLCYAIFLNVFYVQCMYSPYLSSSSSYYKPKPAYISNRSCEYSSYYGQNIDISIMSYNTNYNYTLNSITFKIIVTDCTTISIDTKFTTSIYISYSHIPTSSNYSMFSRGGIFLYTMIGEIYITLIDNIDEYINFTIYNATSYPKVNFTTVNYSHYNLYIENQSSVITYYVEWMEDSCDIINIVNIFDRFPSVNISYDLNAYFTYTSASYDINITIISNCSYNLVLLATGNNNYLSPYDGKSFFFNSNLQDTSKYIAMDLNYNITETSMLTIHGYHAAFPINGNYPPLTLQESIDIYSQLINLTKKLYTGCCTQDVDDLILYADYTPASYDLTSTKSTVNTINNLINTKVRYFDPLIPLMPSEYYWVSDTMTYSIKDSTFSSSDILSINLNSISSPSILYIESYTIPGNVTVEYPNGTVITYSTPVYVNLPGNYIDISTLNASQGLIVDSVVYITSSNYNFSGILQLSSSTLALSDSVLGVGGLVLGYNSDINISGNSRLDVTSCVNLTGNLNINVNTNSSKTLVTYPCHTGTFSNVNINNNHTSCYNYDMAYSESSVVLNINPCESTPSINLYYLIIPGILIPLIVVVLIISLKVKRIRKIIFPYKDRTFHKVNTSRKPQVPNA